jgi:hypothetical protein
MTGGDDLNARIEASIRSARHVLVIVSLDALGSEWVQREVRIAQDEAQRRTDGYKVIPVVPPGVQKGHLKLLFPGEPLYIPIAETPTGLSDAMPQIFAALGMQLPEDWETTVVVQAAPVEDLILKLTDPVIKQTPDGVHPQDGVRRAEATAELIYKPAAEGVRAITSRRYRFSAPLGPVELEMQRPIECIRPFGHAATPWKSFDILHDIEAAEGNAEAARAAWTQARDAYLAYRRRGVMRNPVVENWPIMLWTSSPNRSLMKFSRCSTSLSVTHGHRHRANA